MKLVVAVALCFSGLAFADEGTSRSAIEFPIDAQTSSAEISAVKAEAEVVPKFSPNKSIFFFMPPVETTAARLNYSQSSMKDSNNSAIASNNDSEYKISNYQFGLTYAFDESTVAFLNTGFESSETVRPNDSNRYNVSNGMSDIFIGGQKLIKGEKTNLVYGGTLGIPPEAKSNSTYRSNSESNASSGMLSLNPYFGTETNFAGGVAGVKVGASFFIYKQERSDDGTVTGSYVTDEGNGWSMNPIYSTNLYYEFAIAKPVKMGVTAGLTRNEQEGRPGNAWINERQAEIYSEGRVWQDIYVNGSLGARTLDYGTARTMTTAQIGLKKLL